MSIYLLFLITVAHVAGWSHASAPVARWRASTPKMGVQVKTLTAPPPGAQKPKSGDVVLAHYTGWLKTSLGSKGNQFDTSRGGIGPFQKPPFKFALGRNRVIKAWDVGIAKMKIGETARLTCTSDVCYGRDGAGPIPPNADLIFEARLSAPERVALRCVPLCRQALPKSDDLHCSLLSPDLLSLSLRAGGGAPTHHLISSPPQAQVELIGIDGYQPSIFEK